MFAVSYNKHLYPNLIYDALLNTEQIKYAFSYMG